MLEKLPQDIESINDKLVSKFGNNESNKPRYKIVWSENELEHRKVFHVDKIQLLYPIVREVKKYGYIKDRYILEKWMPGLTNDELVNINNGNYEPLWVFQNKSFESVRPVWRFVEILANASEGDIERMTLKDYISQDEKEQQKEIQLFEDMLGEGTNYGNQQTNFVKPVYLNSGKK